MAFTLIGLERIDDAVDDLLDQRQIFALADGAALQAWQAPIAT